jgi:hypothetical protein
MIKTWITCSDLCIRWGINKYTLAEIINDGKLDSFFAEDFSYLVVTKDGSYRLNPEEGTGGFRQRRITGDDVTDLIFRTSDIEEYEKLQEQIQEPLALVPVQSKEKRRSRSSDDRALATQLAIQYIKRHNKPNQKLCTRLEAANYIKPKLSKPLSLRTINEWITPYFPEEARKSGRPTKKNEK